MDGRRFDQLARNAARSRRAVLGTMVTMAGLGLVGRPMGGGMAVAAECRDRRPRDCDEIGEGLDCVNGRCKCIKNGRCRGCSLDDRACVLGEDDTGCGHDGESCKSCPGPNTLKECIERGSGLN
jgi:hypothetical protein